MRPGEILPNRDKLMVRQAHHEAKPLKARDLILSLSKDEAEFRLY
ncbi:MAG: hypothetical protein WCF79_12420 [Rhodomicrobium sp.]